MMYNIEENLFRLPLINQFFSFNSYARGYHVYIYMNIWNPLDGEILVFILDTNNTHDNYNVSIMRNSYVVDHVHLGLSKPF